MINIMKPNDPIIVIKTKQYNIYLKYKGNNGPMNPSLSIAIQTDRPFLLTGLEQQGQNSSKLYTIPIRLAFWCLMARSRIGGV